MSETGVGQVPLLKPVPYPGHGPELSYVLDPTRRLGRRAVRPVSVAVGGTLSTRETGTKNKLDPY